MTVILYSTATNKAGSLLQRVLETLVPEDQREIHRTIDSLSRRLRQPHPAENMTIAVFLANSREELREILSIRELLKDVRVILILPDREKETFIGGNRLRPRFVSYRDSNFLDVSAVLSKMLGEGYHSTVTPIIAKRRHPYQGLITSQDELQRIEAERVFPAGVRQKTRGKKAES